MSEQIKLRDFAGAERLGGRGSRFVPSRYNCPRCQGDAYQDDDPPNYSGGGLKLAPDGTFESHYGGTVKGVCLNCRIAFMVSFSEDSYRQFGMPYTTASYFNLVPLVEREGVWLTPHDVQDDEYKALHGHPPRRSYS